VTEPIAEVDHPESLAVASEVGRSEGVLIHRHNALLCAIRESPVDSFYIIPTGFDAIRIAGCSRIPD